MTDRETIKSLAGEYETLMMQHYTYLHAHPELAFAEFETSAYIQNVLTSAGISVQTFPDQTSVVGTIVGAIPGPTIAFRADMDALPIQEKTGLPYQSQVAGVMHACGHDSHVAVLLAFAQCLAAHPELIQGTVKFIFQAAEEKMPGGAYPLCRAGVMDDVDEIYAFHSSSMVPVGVVATTAGATSANSATFDIVLQGKGGHICNPEYAVNPLPAACALANAINQMLGDKVSPLEKAVLMVTYLNCGQRDNIIPEEAKLGGSLRSFNNNLAEQLLQRIDDVCKGICTAYGCSYELQTKKSYPAAINTERETHIVNRAVAKMQYEHWTTEPHMNGEDFAYYLMEKPGSLYYIGMAAEQPEPHHNCRFVLNPEGFSVALEMELAVYLEACEARNQG